MGRDYTRGFQNIGNVLFLKLEDSYRSRGPGPTPELEGMPNTPPAICSIQTQGKGQRVS